MTRKMIIDTDTASDDAVAILMPLLREIAHATFFHGQDGMGNMYYPAPQAAPARGHAVDTLIETIKANPGIILVTLGPLTNVALAVAKAPEIAEHVGLCVLMAARPAP